MNYTPEILSRLHDELIDILAETVRVCDKCGIPYFIQGGTAIGAFFYADIIPWDDDIDVGLTRDNYNRFLEVAPQMLGADYFLSEFTTEPDTPFYYAKVMKRNTLFEEEVTRGLPIEKGIYIDIFPYDLVPDIALLEKIHRTRARFVINCFMAKTLWPWRWFAPVERESYAPKSFLSCLAVKFATSVWSKRQLYRIMNRTLGFHNRHQHRYYNIVRMPRDQIAACAINNPTRMRLGRLEVWAPSDVETYLRHHYRNLRRDIPVGEQVNHAPVRLSFDLANGETYE